MRRITKLKYLVGRLGVILVAVLFIATSVNAYTVILKGGRRVEVTAKFVLTESTLTYETSPGVQITVAVAAINIPETEKANGEPAGSFLKRVGTSVPEKEISPQVLSAAPRRTITNRDLESVKQRRHESEQAYEARRKQLGLPTIAESRRQAAAESALVAVELEERRLAEDEAERYWRDRATTLRTEIAAVDAELAYVRASLDEGSVGSVNNWSSASVSNFGLGLSLGNFGRSPFGRHGWGGRSPYGTRSRRNIFVSPHTRAGLTGQFGFGGRATQGRIFNNPGPMRHGGSLGGFQSFGNVGVLTTGAPLFDYSYERSELILRINELGATRAGLIARWRELEEEARRAGAPPGWLRP